MKTIVAIATPPGHGGIGIVRISGPQSLDIAKKMFNGSLEPRVATLGTIDAGIADQAIAIYFKAPHSFTGEDVVEFQLHGGYLLLEKVVDHAVKLGCSLAENGEFTKRAFLNGKLSLDQAEGIIDTIMATSPAALQNATTIYAGTLKDKLKAMETVLVECVAKITVTLDYPEHDEEVTTKEQIKIEIEAILKQLDELISSSIAGRFIANGIQIAMVGKPNVGKSSLFNALLSKNRSIVTDIQGTTRDMVTETIHYKGLSMVFHDTAGLRDSSDKVEKLGIHRTREAIQIADIVVCIFDVSAPPQKEDLELINLSKDKNAIFILNKSDKPEHTQWKELLIGKQIIRTSALKNRNLDTIKETIYKQTYMQAPQINTLAITNARHLAQLQHAHATLSSSLANIDSPLDCISIDINTALSHIGNISGTSTSDKVLDEIFSRFCIGK